MLGATATTPTGTVSFFADAATTAFASCTLSGTGSSASCSVTYTPTTAGAHAITASYGGDATQADAHTAAAAAVTDIERPTTTSINCTPASFTPGASTSCTATVTDVVVAPSLHDALPILSFFADAATTAFASCTLSGTGSSASCSVTYTPTTAGAHAITASYGGDATHEGSSGATAAAMTVTKDRKSVV